MLVYSNPRVPIYALGPFEVSSETYMFEIAKQKVGHLKFYRPLFKPFFENFLWYILMAEPVQSNII